MHTLTFREVGTGKTFTANPTTFRYLGSVMQDIRDSVPPQFRAATDWARVFADNWEPEPVVAPDSYAPALEARATAETIAARVKRTSGQKAYPRISSDLPHGIDGYAEAIRAAQPPTVVHAAIDENDGYAVGLRARGVVYQFPVVNTDGYAVALAKREE